MNGKMKWYNGVKGYGFITKEDGSEIFFHHTDLMVEKIGREVLRRSQGIPMSFDEEKSPRGVKATNVRIRKALTNP